MKNIIRSVSIFLPLLVVAVAYGATPPISVVVSDASGKAAFKGTTGTNGSFATGKLQPGSYIVQFNTTNPAVKGSRYALVISAGKKKVSASAVAGEKFTAGGVAMKVDVAAGLNITGQVATETNVVMKNGKKMVFIKPATGSNLPGRWVEEGSAEAVSAYNSGQIRSEDVTKIQNHGDASALGR